MLRSAKKAGRIGRTHAESERWFEPRLKAPAGSPNVIYVVLDDVGYADLGCYGSSIATPNFDSLAARGLRYSNFHTTTLCSPTRASLLTGRNHHAVGMRFLANLDMGWANGRGAISPRAATVAEMLRGSGYSTFAVGKWHVAPTEDASAAGPFDHWPLGRGFERFYGFMNGGTDQFYPELFEDNHAVEQPRLPEHGYHLSADLVDRAIGMIGTQTSLTPDKPFFLYLCFGAGHFPHQAPQAFLDKYRGRFDAGWDVERERRLARQKSLGLVPESVVLPPSNPGVKPWSELGVDERAVALRMQEAYAAFLDCTDHEFGRLLAFLDRVGRRDDTLVVLISDNGASCDCGPEGTTNILRFFNGLPETPKQNLSRIDAIGGPLSYGNYPWGWSQASNTPLRLYKSFTHGGGVRDPMIVSWPSGIGEHGGIRRQFHHVTDITPTVLEICGIEAPEVYRGIPQMPVHGTSFAYTFAEAEAPTRKPVQYFEMLGHRGIWHDGWKAVTRHVRGSSFETERWELYHLDTDFAETRDLADAEPRRLQEMKERWWAEAGRYDVMPMDDVVNAMSPVLDDTSIRRRASYVYYPPVPAVPSEAGPTTGDASHRIRMELDLPAGSRGGTILTYGNAHGGYGFFIAERRLVYAYNYCGEISHILSDSEVPSGRVDIAFEFLREGKGGLCRLSFGDTLVAEQRLERVLSRATLAALRFGAASLPPVSPRISGPSPLDGAVCRVSFDILEDRTQPARIDD